MKIAVIGHIRFPIAPPFMGGMEAHCWHLCRGLRARGHDVTLFAAGDSDWGGKVEPVIQTHYDRVYPWHKWHGTQELTDYLDQAFERLLPRIIAGGFDVVHNNSLHRFPPRFATRDRIPMVTSLHVPPFKVLKRAVADGGTPWSLFTTCSKRQLSAWFDTADAPFARVVPNGIDLDAWPFCPEGDGTAVWMGRITPTKGTHLAVQAARLAGIPLRFYGTIENQTYFDEEIAPLLSADVQYGGLLKGADLAREIARSSVLLFTPLWDEPFGLAAIEAMACGLPIAAIENGAIREVAGDVAEYATADAGDLARALKSVLKISRNKARQRAEQLFTLDQMLSAYEALYARAIDGTGEGFEPPPFEPLQLPPFESLASRSVA
ncbi:putative sugar transferase [Sulfitobacter noctilucae]|uniref:glycosyltransferase family 4 protein n=1 Tax=Sulfitobacter noctilucae TaxID=1342302 RepID=UPI0004686395|nr:glycosyltransferase family 4 protein [Sulfitobacter noctilucae]KIN70581.1 putative sugar transferase [Sulfitobacter noctilucae]